MSSTRINEASSVTDAGTDERPDNMSMSSTTYVGERSVSMILRVGRVEVMSDWGVSDMASTACGFRGGHATPNSPASVAVAVAVVDAVADLNPKHPHLGVSRRRGSWGGEGQNGAHATPSATLNSPCTV